jgi:hypothetical protein
MLAAVALLLVHASSTTAQNKDNSFKNRFQVIEVSTFEAPAETKFPAENVKPMMDEIVSKLIGLKKFKQVVRPGEAPTDTAAPIVQLVGTVTKYEPGSRAKRYVISMGAGKTRIVTHIKFVDKSTGQVLLESDASGAVSWGLFGGSSKSSLTGVGKKVAEITKRNFF